MISNLFYNRVLEDTKEDWQLQLAGSKKRHVEQIEGATSIFQSWRMKERVGDLSLLALIS